MQLRCFIGDVLIVKSNFINLHGKQKLVRKIGDFEKSGVKLHGLTEEGKRLLLLVNGRLTTCLIMPFRVKKDFIQFS